MAATDFATEGQIDSLVTNVASAVKANTTAIGTKTDDTAVTNHTGDASGAHAASAISVADVGTIFTATEVEAALAEVKTIADTNASTLSGGLATVATSGSYDDLSNLPTLGTAAASATGDFATAAQGTASDDHIADTTAAHAASAISFLDTADDYTATTVEAALAEVRVVADAAAGGGVAINDGLTNGTDAWSSQKITDYTATAVSGLIDSAPGALDTLNELAAAIGDDASFATTMTTALGLRVRVDAAQGFTAPQQLQGRQNIGVIISAVDFASNFNTAIA